MSIAVSYAAPLKIFSFKGCATYFSLLVKCFLKFFGGNLKFRNTKKAHLSGIVDFPRGHFKKDGGKTK
jgi:hypothetical protein